MVVTTCDVCYSNIEPTEKHMLVYLVHSDNPMKIDMKYARAGHVCQKCINERKYWSMENLSWDKEKEQADRDRKDAIRKQAEETEKNLVPPILRPQE